MLGTCNIILCVLLCSLSLSLSATITFNSTLSSECTSSHPCLFNNASIWIPNRVPNTYDNVIISSLSSLSSPISPSPVIHMNDGDLLYGYYLISLSNSTLSSVSLLPLQVVDFKVENGSSLHFNNIKVINEFILDGSSFFDVENISGNGGCFFSGTILSLQTNFQCQNINISNSYTFNKRIKSFNINTGPDSIISFRDGMDGRLNAGSNSSVTINSHYSGPLNVGNFSTVTLIDLDSSSYVQQYYGIGKLIVYSTHITFHGDCWALNLVFGGNVNVTMKSGSFMGRPWTTINGLTGEPPQITVSGHEYMFAAAGTFIGDFYLYNLKLPSWYYAPGFIVDGSLTLIDCDMKLNFPVRSENNITVIRSIVNITEPFSPTNYQSYPFIAANIITFDNNSILTCQSSNAIFLHGLVINSGKIDITLESFMRVNGSVILTPTSIIKFNYTYYESLYVSGDAEVAGTVDFYYVGSHSFTLLAKFFILETKGKLINRFDIELLAFAGRPYNFNYHYTSDTLSIVYTQLHWLWVALALTGLGLVLVMVFCNRKIIMTKCRPRLASYGLMV